jgi:hypothetical protein
MIRLLVLSRLSIQLKAESYNTTTKRASTTSFKPSRRRLRASPQPGNPLPYTLHNNMSARLKEAQLSHNSIVCRQGARKNDTASRAIYLPELTQASRRSAADTRLVSHAFAEAASIFAVGDIAAPTAAV